MAILWDQDDLVLLSDAAKLLPSRPHASTIWRWYRSGIRGHRLSTIVIGGRRYTTRSALQEFAERLTNTDGERHPQARTTRQRTRAAQSAERALRDAGM